MDTGLKIGIDGRPAVAGAAQVNRALDSVKAKAISTTNVMNKRWKALTSHFFSMRSAVASMGVALALTATIKTVTSFEQSMANVAAVSRATNTELIALSTTARRLGATTKYSASQAGQGLEFLARAGFETDRAIRSMPVVLNLAAAANLTLARSAEITANVMAGFKLGTEGAAHAADVLATAASRTNTDVSMMAEAMKFVGPVAIKVGMSIEDTAAMLGALSDAGMAGSMAGTGLRKVISSLAAPTKEATKLLASMGLNVADLDPRTNSLVDIMEKLRKANMGAGEALSIFGDRGGPAALILADMVPRVRQLTEVLDDSAGAATRMANIMNDTLRGAFLTFKSAIEEAMIATGEAGLKGTIRDTIEMLTALVRHLGGSLDPMNKYASAVENLTVTLKALIAVGLAIFIGKITVALSAFILSIKAAAIAAGSLKLAMFAFITPLGIAATAIGTLVAGVVLYRKELLALIGIQSQANDGINGMGEAIVVADWIKPFGEARERVLDLESSIRKTQKALDDMNKARNRGIGKFAALYVPGVAMKQCKTVNALGERIRMLNDRLVVAKDKYQGFVSVISQGGDVMEYVNGAVDDAGDAFDELNNDLNKTVKEETAAAKAARLLAEAYGDVTLQMQNQLDNQRIMNAALGKGAEVERNAIIQIRARETAESIGMHITDERFESIVQLTRSLTLEEEKTRDVTAAIEEKKRAEEDAANLLGQLTEASKSNIDQVIAKWQDYAEILKVIEVSEGQRAAMGKIRATEMREATIRQMDSWTAVKYSIEDMTKEATNGYQNAVNFIQDMNHLLTDAFTDMFVNGTMNIKSLEKEVLASITRMIIKAEIAKMTMAASNWLSDGSGILGSLFNGASNDKTSSAGTSPITRPEITSVPIVPGFANGGISTSPGLATVSEGRHRKEAHVPLPNGRSIPVDMGDQKSGMTVNFNVSTPDADSFRKSQSQMMESAYTASVRNKARNGG